MDDDKDEKYLENPAYEDTYVHVTTPHARTISPEKQQEELSSLDSTYEVVGETLLQGELENGDVYDSLNRELTSGKHSCTSMLVLYYIKLFFLFK